MDPYVKRALAAVALALVVSVAFFLTACSTTPEGACMSTWDAVVHRRKQITPGVYYEWDETITMCKERETLS
jgi:hypothetical protein